MPRQEKTSLYKKLRRFLRRKKSRLKQSGWRPPPDPVNVPPDIEILEMIGQGRRSCTYRAQFQGRQVAVKVYRLEYLHRYRWRFRIHLAQFEHDRNRAFWDCPALRPYTVEPLRVLGVTDDYSPAFVQSWAEGIQLPNWVKQYGPVPAETLAAGYRIVATAAALGLHDLDISPGNIKLHKLADGWIPLIYDFNLLPQHLYAPNPLRGLAFRLGLRPPGYRDCAALEGWANQGVAEAWLHLV